MERREIKFRVWDGKRMYGNYDLAIVDGLPYLCTGVDPIEPYPDDSVLMQYTGLKDADGKEIYEGDILEFEYGYLGTLRGTVEWVEHGFWVRATPEGTRPIWPYEPRVIGNIYENSDQLQPA